MKSLPIDEQVDYFLVSLLTQYYGDLLKVSRTRGVLMNLPQLRKYISENPFILEHYQSNLDAEIEGQGLQDNAILKTLQAAQLKAFEEADYKNNTLYSSEMKKIITEGKNVTDGDGNVIAVANKINKVSLVDKIINDPLNVDISEITNDDCVAVRNILNNDFEKFALWTFEIQMGFKFQRQDFHSIIFNLCQEIVDGKHDRVIVTIPPRHSKTQIFSISLPLFSFCHNPGSHNIITSYADDVVSESSGYVRSVMTSELFMKVYPQLRIDSSKRSLERWGTTKMGVLHAVPTGGKLTGKGAGSLSTEYSGVFVVDDSIKPKDAYSPAMRDEINNRYDNTFMSRLANDGEVQDDNGKVIKCARTPIVIIMQRVHDMDLVGYLLRGNSSDKYAYLNIPGIIEKETGSKEWYDKILEKQSYTHAEPILYKLDRPEYPSALWPSRKSLDSLKAMQIATPYTFNSQYMGDPTAQGTGLVQEAWWQEWYELDRSMFSRTFMTADTASTVQTYSDYSVCVFWGVTYSNDLYMLDVMLGKFETPELKTELIKFWNKHNVLDIKYPTMLPTALYMEDKSSGQFLNQQFTRDGSIRILPVPKDKTSGDKVARFLNAIPYFAQGRIWFPQEHVHKQHVMREVLNMTGMGSGTGNDDVIDNISDACAIVYSGGSANYEAWVN